MSPGELGHIFLVDKMSPLVKETSSFLEFGYDSETPPFTSSVHVIVT